MFTNKLHSGKGSAKNAKKKTGDFLIHRAVEREDMEQIKELVTLKGLDVNEVNAVLLHPLFRSLSLKIAGIDSFYQNGDTPLIVALRLKKEEVSLFLLECGADPTLANTEVRFSICCGCNLMRNFDHTVCKATC
jgi:ankyrin repeat protein